MTPRRDRPSRRAVLLQLIAISALVSATFLVPVTRAAPGDCSPPPAPSSTPEPTPQASGGPPPAASEEPTPAASEGPPAASEEPTPAASEGPATEPPPPATEEPPPAASEEPTPAASEGPATETQPAETQLENTGSGADICVVPTDQAGSSPVSIEFGDVSGGGVTTLTTSTTAPPLPSGFQLSGSPVFYDIETTASYSGPITVCINYGDADPPPTSLLHYDTSLSAWVDITTSIDTVNQLICGSTTSLSPFAITVAALPTIHVPSAKAAVATGATGAVVRFTATATDYTGAALPTTCSPVSGAVFPIGVTTVTCAAVDRFGRSATGSFPVSVGYRFAGFASPLDGVLKIVKTGSVVPVKFQLLYANGKPIGTTEATALAASCTATISTTLVIGRPASAGGTLAGGRADTGVCFRYDKTAKQFVFNLGTRGLASPALYLVNATFTGVPILAGSGSVQQVFRVLLGIW